MPSRFPFASAALSTAWLLVFVCAPVSVAQSEPTLDAQRGMIHPDDAPLYDVEFVDSRNGWACGAEGVIWRTADGGESWTRQVSGTVGLLRDICFLTDSIGWIAGEGTIPHTRTRFGILLATRDGGATWTRSPLRLPPLKHVRFFGLKEGMLVGTSSVEFPNGLLRTTDGGESFQPVPGPNRFGWQTAALATADLGVLAGHRGEIAAFGNGRLLKPKGSEQGLRAYRAAAVDAQGNGWLVGDGALLMRTTTRGAIWEPPTKMLPASLTEFVDFRAVASRGEQVWIGGNPGAVLFFSPDAGASWQTLPTGQPLPINAVHFRDDRHGCLVGEMGLIMTTADGGRTWTRRRIGDRSAALLEVASSAQDITLPLHVEQGAELGYRSVVLLPLRRDVEPDGHIERDPQPAIEQAVRFAGGTGVVFDWQWPLSLPDIERSQTDLLAEWSTIHERRVGPKLLGKMVATLRTYRPAIVIVAEPAPDDAAAKLLAEGLEVAIQQAADPTAYPQHLDLGLRPHRVTRLFRRRRVAGVTRPDLDPQRYLARIGQASGDRALDALGLLIDDPQPYRKRVGLEPVNLATSAQPPFPGGNDLFVGTPLSPDSEKRRPLLPWRTHTEAEQRRLARQRTFRGYVASAVKDDRQAAALIAQLRDTMRGWEADRAAKQLDELAESYRDHGRYLLAEATWLELIERYPAHPVTVDAMRQLFWRWSSEEVSWQQATTEHLSTARTVEDGGVAVRQAMWERLRRVESYLRTAPSERTTGLELNAAPNTTPAQNGVLKINFERNAPSTKELSAKQRQEGALRLAGVIEKYAPHLFAEPAIQFPLAGLLRRTGRHRLADTIQNRYRLSGEGNPWKRAADSESWLVLPQHLAPKAIYDAKPTAMRPHLDGVFSDACWHDAPELLLTDPADPQPRRILPGENGEPENDSRHDPARIQFRYDRQYLYLAASVPRYPQTPAVQATHPGRRHDADLAGQDRLRLCFDIDRDHLSYFEIEIDQRGQVRETCWNDPSWNPKLFVFAVSTETHWRLEVAIPLDQLSPMPPPRGTVWGLGVDRLIPGRGQQSWTHPATRRVTPQYFGLLKFSRQ